METIEENEEYEFVIEETEPEPDPEPETEPDQIENIVDGNESDTSDESLNSEELNDLQNNLSTSFDNENEDIVITPQPIIIKPTKQKRGRPKIPNSEKKGKTIIKEKRIYMIQDDNGQYIEKKIKPLTARQLQKIELENKNTQLEIEMGKKLIRTKKGKVDNRSSKERTPAQIAHSKKLVELNRLRREKRKMEENETLNKTIDNSVKSSMVKIITAPKEIIKEVIPDYEPPKPRQKTNRELYNDFFG